MSKGSGGTRGSSWRDKQTGIKEPPVMKKFELFSDGGETEFGDYMKDWYLPKAIKDNLGEYGKLQSYNDLVKHFASRGIEFSTELQKWKDIPDEFIEAPIVAGQKFAVAVDTYRHIFGKDALSSLKKIVLYSDENNGKAAYYFNRIGENDPLAGTIRTKDFRMGGREIFHELAHAFQDSHKNRGEDAVTAAERIVKAAKLSDNQNAYFNARSADIQAERMADAFGYGFQNGNGRTGRLEFIERVYDLTKKKR